MANREERWNGYSYHSGYVGSYNIYPQYLDGLHTCASLLWREATETMQLLTLQSTSSQPITPPLSISSSSFRAAIQAMSNPPPPPAYPFPLSNHKQSSPSPAPSAFTEVPRSSAFRQRLPLLLGCLVIGSKTATWPPLPAPPTYLPTYLPTDRSPPFRPATSSCLAEAKSSP